MIKIILSFANNNLRSISTRSVPLGTLPLSVKQSWHRFAYLIKWPARHAEKVTSTKRIQ